MDSTAALKRWRSTASAEPAGTRVASAQRISPDPDAADGHIIAYRTWRLHYRIDDAARRVTVTDLRSGYSPADLAPGTRDRHQDKDVHRAFGGSFSAS